MSFVTCTCFTDQCSQVLSSHFSPIKRSGDEISWHIILFKILIAIKKTGTKPYTTLPSSHKWLTYTSMCWLLVSLVHSVDTRTHMIQTNEMQITDGTEQCFYVLLKSGFTFLSPYHLGEWHIQQIIQLTHTFLTKHLQLSMNYTLKLYHLPVFWIDIWL